MTASMEAEVTMIFIVSIGGLAILTTCPAVSAMIISGLVWAPRRCGWAQATITSTSMGTEFPTTSTVAGARTRFRFKEAWQQEARNLRTRLLVAKT